MLCKIIMVRQRTLSDNLIQKMLHKETVQVFPGLDSNNKMVEEYGDVFGELVLSPRKSECPIEASDTTTHTATPTADPSTPHLPIMTYPNEVIFLLAVHFVPEPVERLDITSFEGLHYSMFFC